MTSLSKTQASLKTKQTPKGAESTPDSKPDPKNLGPKITVVGVGGAGNNAVNNMIRYNLQGVSYLALNTDAQHLNQSLVSEECRLQLGIEVTQGLGAGSHPEVGRAAAEESLEEVLDHIKGSNMVFITAGMGGGTGTGAAPVIAQAAREMGILTVGVVTKPFHFEGPHRMRMADGGIIEMEQFVDTLIIIPNQNLFRVATEKTTFADAFKMADDVLYSGVRGVTDLMIMPGLVNLDFADIRAVMTEMGKAMMGTGEAGGEGRAIAAAEAAISNPLLDDISMRGAKGVLINITGGLDMTLFEVDEAANRIREEIDSDNTIDTNIIFGSTFDEGMEGKIRVSVVATGIDSEAIKKRLSESALEKQRYEGALVFDQEGLDIIGHSAPDVFTDPSDLAEDESIDIYSFETVQSHPQNTEDESLTAAEEQENEAYEDEMPEPRKKKGFLGRFIDTLAGKGETNPEAKRSTLALVHAEDEFLDSPQKKSDDFENTDVQDIPAYLRRKTK
jgi:cell division protein FtsZ